MSNGTIHHPGRKAIGPEWRDKRDMLPVSTAKMVWANLQTLMAARNLTLTQTAEKMGAKRATLVAVAEGTLSRELMRRIKKWASSA